MQIFFHPHWYIIGIGLLTLFLGVTLYKPLTQFKPLDKIPIIHTPIGVAPNINAIETGLFLRDFSKFNIIQNQFELEGALWFLYNPLYVSSSLLDNFQVSYGEVMFIGKPLVFAVGNQELRWYNVRLRFSSSLQYHRFPIDVHRISLVIYNAALANTRSTLITARNALDITEIPHTPGWNLIQHQAKEGYWHHTLQTHEGDILLKAPSIQFTLDFKRIGIRHLLVIILPLFLMYLMVLFAVILSFSSLHRSAITIVTAAIAAIIAYRFVLESLSPEVDYLMLSDYIYLLFLSASFLLFLLIVMYRHIGDLVRILLTVGVQIVVVILWYYYFNIWL